jgi:hypothetical protein
MAVEKAGERVGMWRSGGRAGHAKRRQACNKAREGDGEWRERSRKKGINERKKVAAKDVRRRCYGRGLKSRIENW